ncbi:hypothetical protein AJ80_03255 [Polytolypa hystricis UAMH7299]|uniref:N-acetyltransferase domain-containing protein n=1 Tax=Polytolypa hystricis (strain UAMH7299) TaxID=1447883 RepID=A0A2B7YBM1_POLH7|nr:hypothetical protein AJ80_03255 [Polytolypa hystricis UAMH7299]
MHIRSLTSSDIPYTATLSADNALLDDELFAYICPHRQNHYPSFRAGFVRRAKIYLSTPGFVSYVAVTDDGDGGPGVKGGEVVGVARWERKGDGVDARRWRKKNEGLWCKLETTLLSLESHYTTLLHLDKSVSPSNLTSFLRRTSHIFPASVFPELWFLDALVVSQHWHRRGIGAQLLKWGLETAASEGVPVGLEASRMGEGLYRKFGFRTLEMVEWQEGVWSPVMLWEPEVGKGLPIIPGELVGEIEGSDNDFLEAFCEESIDRSIGT